MPVIKSAVKKLRQAQKKTVRNKAVRRGVKDLLDAFKKKPVPSAYAKLSSALDKAAKTGVLHQNKAARLKSRLAKMLKSPAKEVPSKSPSKPKKSVRK